MPDGDVQRALAPRPRACPACGERSTTQGRACPRCGADFVAPRPPHRFAALLTAAAVVAIALGTVAIAVLNAGDAAKLSKRPERSGADQNAERTAAERSHRGRAARGASASAVVAAVERAVTDDARRRARSGELDGPIRGTECRDTTGGGDPLTTPGIRQGALVCIAITHVNTAPDSGRARVTYTGHRFDARVDFRRGTFTWKRVFPNSGV